MLETRKIFDCMKRRHQAIHKTEHLEVFKGLEASLGYYTGKP